MLVNRAVCRAATWASVILFLVLLGLDQKGRASVAMPVVRALFAPLSVALMFAWVLGPAVLLTTTSFRLLAANDHYRSKIVASLRGKWAHGLWLPLLFVWKEEKLRVLADAEARGDRRI